MLKLYRRGGGATDIDLMDRAYPQLCERARERAVRLLRERGLIEAADTLQSTPFELWHATNGFADNFEVLHASVPVQRYVELSDLQDDAETRQLFRHIAKALEDGGNPVRFIAATLDEGTEPICVPAPTPRTATTSDVLERALAEVERSLAGGLPAIAVDRVHTALHAHLLAHAETAGLIPSANDGITELFALLRQSHPALQPAGPQAAQITSVLRGMARIVDALNPLRNNASMAHPPTESLLPDAEAMLVINAVRTLIHYLEKKMA